MIQDFRMNKDGLVYAACKEEAWPRIVAGSIEKYADTEHVPGQVRALTPIEPCEKCTVPVLAVINGQGVTEVSEIIQLGVMITPEQAANPQGVVSTNFKIQTVAHQCLPAEIVKMLNDAES